MCDSLDVGIPFHQTYSVPDIDTPGDWLAPSSGCDDSHCYGRCDTGAVKLPAFDGRGENRTEPSCGLSEHNIDDTTEWLATCLDDSDCEADNPRNIHGKVCSTNCGKAATQYVWKTNSEGEIEADLCDDQLFSCCNNNDCDPVWFCPTRKNLQVGPLSDGCSYLSYLCEDDIVEGNILLGFPPISVPEPANFVTVESEVLSELVPEYDLPMVLPPQSDGESPQQVPHSRADGDSQGNLSCHLSDRVHREGPGDHSQDDPVHSLAFCSTPSVSPGEDGVVPVSDLHSPSFQSPYGEGLSGISQFLESSDEPETDLLTADFSHSDCDSSQEFDRPFNSCSVDDQTVPSWAVEE